MAVRLIKSDRVASRKRSMLLLDALLPGRSQKLNAVFTACLRQLGKWSHQSLQFKEAGAHGTGDFIALTNFSNAASGNG